jgi:hypothetical protein
VLPRPKCLAVLLDRPAMRDPQVRATKHPQEPTAQMALHPLVPITNQLPDRRVIVGPVGEGSEWAALGAHDTQYRSHQWSRGCLPLTALAWLPMSDRGRAPLVVRPPDRCRSA